MLTRTTTPLIGSLKLLTAAGSEPVTVDEMKAQARLDSIPEGSSYMTGLIAAASEQARQITGRALITETWTLTLDAWPGCAAGEWWDGMREGTIGMLEADSILIRKAPFLAVSSVKTVAEDGTLTTWSSSNYFASAENGFGRLVKVSGATWPDLSAPVRQRGGIIITFTAGYGTLAADVPAPIRHAIKLIAAHMYENREANDPPQQALTLLSKYRVLN